MDNSPTPSCSYDWVEMVDNEPEMIINNEPKDEWSTVVKKNGKKSTVDFDVPREEPPKSKTPLNQRHLPPRNVVPYTEVYPNKVIIEKTSSNNIVLIGDKSKYGLIVGSKAKTLKSLQNKHKKVRITIPSREDKCEKIFLTGSDAFNVLCDILEIIL